MLVTSWALTSNHAVVIWLGRLSLLTKIDPWPTYAVLERVARQLGRPLVLLSVVLMINLLLMMHLRNCVDFVHPCGFFALVETNLFLKS